MTDTVLGSIIGVLGTIIVALIGLIGVMWRGRTAKAEPNPHPDATKGGDMSVTYWLQSFQRLEDKMDRGFRTLGEKIDSLGRDIRNGRRG